jgi:hypothetical protein
MAEIDVGDNIAKAVKVLGDTYENIQKMFAVLTSEATERGLINPNKYPLRWRSDQDPRGWWLRSMTQLFHLDPQLPKVGVKSNHILFVLEVNLTGCKVMDVARPIILTSAFLYKTEVASERTLRTGLGEQWLYYFPIHNDKEFQFESRGEFDGNRSKPKDESIGSRYQGLIGAVTTQRPLEKISDKEGVKQLLSDLQELEAVALKEFSADMTGTDS